jgi:hypothetical protein
LTLFRTDRDSFITIQWQNIDDVRESNYRIQALQQVVGAYDFNSVMHYEGMEHSINGQPSFTVNSALPEV